MHEHKGCKRISTVRIMDCWCAFPLDVMGHASMSSQGLQTAVDEPEADWCYTAALAQECQLMQPNRYQFAA